MNRIDTTFLLRPGSLPSATVREALRSIVHELQWHPRTFGDISKCDRSIVGDGIEDMMTFYAGERELFAKGDKMEWYFCGNGAGERSASGFVSWSWHLNEKMQAKILQGHLSLSATLAKLLRAPYARACLPEHRRTTRIIEVDAKTISPSAKVATVKKEVPKVRTYRDGLAALYWRNVFGPEFTEMFGGRLGTLPREVAWDLGDGYWMVQPYPNPADAATEAGRAREAEIIGHLGPECFYDDASDQPPTRVPHFTEAVDPLPPLL